MFKGLREKLGDSNNRKKKLSNSNLDSFESDNSNEFSKNSGNQNISRFSSLSSLVSDVGSAITKSITTQHIQPSNSSMKNFCDNESISEYDDSIAAGEAFSKEELFSKYQRAKSFARQYKTRYLEVVEASKKLESENSKLSQILSDSQDKNIRRINELKEQIELDKKGKKDVEENYVLMIEEKTELVNVLKLQVNLLKEGKDLPPELEQQIKENHERQVVIEKNKEDEIKSLKSTLSHREHLLQRCKDKINSLNSELNELKMKYSNITDSTVSNENYGVVSQQHSQRQIDFEHMEEMYKSRIDELIKDFENKKLQLEAKIIENNAEKQFMERELKEKIEHLSLENENLQEQFNIKAKIIQDLMNDQFDESQDYCDPSILNTPIEKLKLCKLILNKYPRSVHPVIDELLKVLSSYRSSSTIDVFSSYTENDSSVSKQDSTNEKSQLKDINEEKKFLLSRIEQLEKIKLACEEENINREKEFSESNLLMEKEKKQFDLKCNSLTNEICNLQTERNDLLLKNEQILGQLTEFQSLLSKSDSNQKLITQEKDILQENCNAFETSLSNMEVEKNNLLQNLKNLHNVCGELEGKLADLSKEYETCQQNLMEKNKECKLLNDRIDELLTSVYDLKNEKDGLIGTIKSSQIDTSSQEEHYSLKIVEIEQRLNKEIEDLKMSIKDKSDKISSLENQSEEFKKEIESYKQTHEMLQSCYDDLKKSNEELMKEKDKLLKDVLSANHEKEVLQSQLNSNTELQQANLKNLQITIEDLKNFNKQLEEKVNNLEIEKERLDGELHEKLIQLEQETEIKFNNSKLFESLQSEFNKIEMKNKSLMADNECLRNNLNQITNENQTLQREISDKTEELLQRYEILNQEKVALNQQFEACKLKLHCYEERSVTDKDILNSLTQEIKELTTNKTELECKVQELEKTCFLLENEKIQLNKSLIDLQEGSVKDLERESMQMSNQLQEEIKNCKMTIEKNKETVMNLQNIIDSKDKQISEDVKIKNDYINAENLLKTHLQTFYDCVEELFSIEDCTGICTSQIDPSIIAQRFLDANPESCGSELLNLTNKPVKKLFLMVHKFHASLHDLKESSKQSIDLHLKSQKDLDVIKREILEMYKIMNLNEDNVEKDIVSTLKLLKNAVLSVKSQLDEKINQLSEIESRCTLLNQKLNLDGLSSFITETNVCSLFGLEKRINCLINEFQQNLLAKEESKRIALLENEKNMEGKLHKSNSLLLKTFKQLINIFHLVDINLNNVSEIDKTTCVVIWKKLKEHVKNQDHLSNELSQTNLKLEATEKELKDTVAKSHDIQTELDELKTSVANDRNRLIATGEQLENSLRRLNEVADEKGRIDEEKQSLRKELKELNEKISNLKLEFEKQSVEKQRLERQFDESLEKVKLNHAALEEVYKRELEKQHGYQRNLEKQIASHKESTSLKLSESERKLEEVLNQSEQLLELNHQYKKLLDESKIECKSVQENVFSLENQNSELRLRIDQLNVENEQLNEVISSLKTTQSEISAECDTLKNDLLNLQTESSITIENVKHLQSANESNQEEWTTIRNECDELKLTNETLKEKIKNFEYSLEEMSKVNQSLLEESRKIVEEKQDLENRINILQKTLEEKELQYHNLVIEKNDLLREIGNSGRACDNLKIENSEFKNLLNTYKNQIEEANLELEQEKMRHDIEKDEMKQQFTEEKENIEEDINRRIKKLAKEFNDKMIDKEKDFQKTFEEALSNIRKEESRMRNDLRSSVDDLNKLTIELQAERNQLLDNLSETETTVKNLKILLNTKENELVSSNLRIEELTKLVTFLQNEKEEIMSKKVSQMNQTIDSGTCYEEPFLDCIGVKDHEVLLMHCSDIEEQLKQLQAENISLKKFSVSHNQLSSDNQETPIKPTKSKTLASQASISSDTNRSSMNFQSGVFRSPNTSCSDYTFCPVPITEATDYEYLHDVLLKYMTGLETEILAKVVCTVMKFSSEETNRVLLFEQDRNKFIRRIL